MTTENSLKHLTGANRTKAGNRSKELSTVASHPLGGPTLHPFALNGFNPQDLLATAADAVPAWQRDEGQKLESDQAASLERHAILKALTQLKKFGVILDDEGRIIQGNSGWTGHIVAIPTLSVSLERLVPTSLQSQLEFLAALKLLFSDLSLASIPVALRDLDGWVIDMLHLQRVGPANPNRAYALLPKSSLDVARTVMKLSFALGLTALETSVVRLIVKGDSDREISAVLCLKPSEIKRTTRQLLAKFKVRQKSDIVRIIASFP